MRLSSLFRAHFDVYFVHPLVLSGQSPRPPLANPREDLSSREILPVGEHSLDLIGDGGRGATVLIELSYHFSNGGNRYNVMAKIA